MSPFFLLLSLLNACQRPSTPGEDAHPDEAHEAEAAEGQSPSVLEVSDDLRRDLRVSTAPAAARGGDERVVLLGEVRVHEDGLAEVAAPLGARVSRVVVQSGATVRKGQLLAVLESVELGHARAAVLAARAESFRASAALQRRRGLGEVVATVEIESAEAEATAARAGLDATEAALAALGAGRDLSEPVDGRFALHAPFDGVVLSRDATLGAVVDAEDVLFRVADLDRCQVEVHAFERDAVRLQAGDHADVELSALPGELLPATVVRVGAEVDVASRTLPVRLEIGRDPRVRPGMAATARLDLAANGGEVVAVPSAALQRLEGGWVAFVPAGEGRFEVRPVGRGRDLDDEVEVITGLAAGEIVVVDGAFLLKAEAEKREGGGDHDHH